MPPGELCSSKLGEFSQALCTDSNFAYQEVGGDGSYQLEDSRQHKAKSRSGRRGLLGLGSACSCPLTNQALSYLQSEVGSGEGHVGEADGSLDVVVTLQDGDAAGQPGLEGRTQWDT